MKVEVKESQGSYPELRKLPLREVAVELRDTAGNVLGEAHGSYGTLAALREYWFVTGFDELANHTEKSSPAEVVAYFNEVEVPLAYRGKGYGAVAAQTLVQEFRRRGARTVYLWVWPFAVEGEDDPDIEEATDRLVKFYESLGFELVDDDWNLADKVVMVRHLEGGSFGGFGRGWRR